MSTAPMPGQYQASLTLPEDYTSAHAAIDRHANAVSQQRDSRFVLNVGLKRSSRLQKAPALGTLSSAVDYLNHSRMFLIDQPATRANSEAVQILMHLSRQVFEEQVFEESAEATIPPQGLRLWIPNSLAAH